MKFMKAILATQLVLMLASCGGGGGGGGTTAVTSCVALPGVTTLPGVVPVSCTTTNVPTSSNSSLQCCSDPVRVLYNPNGFTTKVGGVRACNQNETPTVKC